MTQEQEGYDPLGPFQRAFEIPGDPTFTSDFPSVEITSALPTWRDKAEKGELGNCAFVDLADPRFMHTFDGSSWTVKAMSEVPKFTDQTSVDGLLIKSGHFRGSRQDIFQILDRMAPHMSHGTPVVIHEPTDDREEKIVGQREGTLREHGFELVQMHNGNNVLIWEGRRVNNRAELELALQKVPSIPNELKESLLAQQLPEGTILHIDAESPHNAHPLNRHHDWKPREDSIDPYARPKGSHKLAGVVINLPKTLQKDGLPTGLVARAGSWIRQSEDPKNPHLGGVFLVWPKGEYKPTKKELEKMFSDANLKLDDSQEEAIYEGNLDDGSVVWVAQARTYKFTRPPDGTRGRSTGSAEKRDEHKSGDVVPLSTDHKCDDCGERKLAERYVEGYWKKKDLDILKTEIICNSGKHNGGVPPVLREGRFIRVLGPHQLRSQSGQSTPQRQLSRARQG